MEDQADLAYFNTDAIFFLFLLFLFRGRAFVASGWCYRDDALAGWFGHGRLRVGEVVDGAVSYQRINWPRGLGKE